MNEEILELILAEIDKFHAKDPLRGISAQRDRLAKELMSKKKFEIRRDMVTGKNPRLCNHHGQLVDLAGDVELIIDQAPYVARRSDAAEKARYISKFERPSKEARAKMKKDMEGVLQKLIKLSGIVPVDPNAFNRALDLIASNFLYEIEDGKVLFGKLNESGLVGSSRYSLEEMLPHHLIDSDKTALAQEIKNSEVKALAKKLLDSTSIRTVTLDQKVAFLKKHELLATIEPRQLPQISRSEIERETVRKEALIRGLNPDAVIRGGGQTLADLNRIAKREYESLDDVRQIKQGLTEIKPAGVPKYENLSYHE